MAGLQADIEDFRRDLGVRLDAEEAARGHAEAQAEKRMAELERQMETLGAAVGRAGAAPASPGKESPSPVPKTVPPGLATPPRSPGAQPIPLSPEVADEGGGTATVAKLEASVFELRGSLKGLEDSVQALLADQKEELVNAITKQMAPPSSCRCPRRACRRPATER